VNSAIDIDRMARAVDLRKMGPRGLAQLIETMDLLTKAETGIDLAEVSTATLARLVAGASDEQLAELGTSAMARNAVLDEVFRRMVTQMHASRAASVSGVIKWRIACGATEDGGDDPYLRFQTVLADGVLTTSTKLDQPPTITLTMSIVDFLRIAVGSAGIVSMFARHRLAVRGEFSFALRFMWLLDIPKASRV
jgi:hypothetical protein